MAIITISRRSYSRGKEIAKRVAEELGYATVSRAVLLSASDQFNIPEIVLVRALHDAPSVLERFTHGRQEYLAHIEKTLLESVQNDNTVYHGLAGHFFLTGVSHTLKVRIIADLEDRVRLAMKRENMSSDEARRLLKKDDRERRKWALALYGRDTADASLYDLVIRIRKLTVSDAVNIICQTAQLPHFRTTAESQKALDDLVLAAQVKSAIVRTCPYARISADGGRVTVHLNVPATRETAISKQIVSLVNQVPGVEDTRVRV